MVCWMMRVGAGYLRIYDRRNVIREGMGWLPNCWPQAHSEEIRGGGATMMRCM